MPLLPRPPAAASLVVDLARIVGASNVSNMDADRIAYSRDCWPRDLLRLRAGQLGAAPLCVVWPESSFEVARVLSFAEQAQVPVVPYGAGSGVCGGARPSEGGIALDMKRMRTIRRFDEENLRIEAEVGLIGERLERMLEKRGYSLGHFPSSIGCSTLGGWLAARSAGQMSTLYGKIEDMVHGVELATPGQLRRLMLGPRPGNGPDFNALIVGSEGTFGAICAAELRMRPQPQTRAFRGFRFGSVKQGVEAIRKLMRAGIRPSVVRLYDSLDTLVGRGHGDDDEGADVRSLDALAGRANGLIEELQSKISRSPGKPGLMGRLSGALRRGTVRAVLGAPLVLNRALNVLPEDSLLVLGFEGQRALVMAEVEEASGICASEGAEALGPGPGEHWYKNRYNMSYKQSKMYALGVFVDTMEVAATWDRLMPMYKAVRKAIGRDALVMAHFSHAYGEGCSIYFTFAGAATQPGDPAEALERYDRIWRNALIAVHETGGTISHHHGVGESKAAGMAREHGPGGVQLLSALKTAFDPRGVLNPGKLGLQQMMQRRRPLPRRPSTRAPIGQLPAEIAAAVGERNISVSGGRTTVRPPDESALAALLRVANPRGVSVVTDQTGFRAPQGSVLIDMSRFEGVSRVSEHALFVEVESGVIVERLERMLNAHQLTLGPVHPRAMMRSIGAAISRNLLIRRGTAYGDLRDLCFAVRGLLASGEPLETRPVPRSATGPELDRAFIGAQGRLGIITRVTLRVTTVPKNSDEVIFEFGDTASAIEAARVALRRGVKPRAGRVLSHEGRAMVALELAAHSEGLLRAQRAIVASAAEAAGGVSVTEGLEPGVALGGRFDAVVEVGALWTSAQSTLAALSEVSGDAWVDFLTPEGVTVVARVVDAETRRATAEAGARAGGRVIAGSRDKDSADLESFRIVLGSDWRNAQAGQGNDRSPGPYNDVLQSVSQKLDPNGVFRGR